MTRRRILLLFATFVALLSGGTYVVLLHTGASHAMMTGLLRRLIRTPFALGDSSIDPATGRVQLRQLQITEPGGAGRSVLSAQRVEIDVNTNPLGEGRLGGLRRVHIDGLDLQLDLADAGSWSWRDLVHLPEGETGGGALPAVDITDSKLTLQVVAGAEPAVFTGVQLSIRPADDDPGKLALEGRMTSAQGFTVRVRGSGDPEGKSFRAVLESPSVALGPEQADPYGTEIRAMLAEAGFAARATDIAVWLQYPGEDGGGRVDARLTANLAAVQLTPAEVPYPITGGTGTLAATTRDGGTVHCRLHSEQGQRIIDAAVTVERAMTAKPALRGGFTFRHIPVDDQLVGALDHVGEVREVLTALSPRGGHADADLHVAARGDGSPPDVSMNLDLHGVTGSFEGFRSEHGQPIRFPYTISDVVGRIRLRPGEVVIDDVTGQRRDGGTVRIRGGVQGLDRGAGNQDISLEIDGTGLAFSDELRAAVAAAVPNGDDIYDRFAPAGRGNVAVRIAQRPAEDASVAVHIEPQGCALTYRGFPYRLEGVAGNILIDAQRVQFDVAGRRGDTTVDVEGRLALDEVTTGLQSELHVAARNIPLDAELRGAMRTLGPELDRPWAQFDPRGVVDCELSLWREAGSADFEHHVRVDFIDGSVGVAQLPHRLRELHGSVVVHGQGSEHRLDVNGLRARSGDDAAAARVLLEGSITRHGENEVVDLTAEVRQLRLDDDLAATLDRLGVLDRDTWLVLAPAGRIDIVNHYRSAPAAGQPRHRTRVVLRDVSSSAAVLPSPATDLRGEIEIVDGQATFEEIRGNLGKAAVICRNGSFGHHDARTFVEVTLASDRLDVDATFAKLMSGPMRDAFLARHVRGPVKVGDLHVHYEFPDGGGAPELSFDGGVIQTNGVSMDLIAPVREVRGTWQLKSGRITPASGTVACAVRGVSFSVLQHRCDELHATLTATPEQITFRDLGLRLHGGEVTGAAGGDALTYRLAGEGELACHLQWRGISLREFLRASGEQAPAAAGNVAGKLDLRQLVGSDLIDAKADGSVSITDGRLGEVPIFSAIYSFLAPKNRPQFDGIDVSFALRNERIEISDLTVTSPLIKVVGGGTIGLDGYLDIVLEFPEFFASAANWLILPAVLNELNALVVRFHVYGYLRQPHARPRWLFQSDPDRVRIGPIPAPIPARRPEKY